MDKTLWIMVGVPGSGKTWYAKNVLMKGPGWAYISRDEIRFSIITNEDEYFEKEDTVFHKFIQTINEAFNNLNIYNIIADATHLNWASRRKLLHALGQKNNKTIDIIPVFIYSPLEEIINNNEERTGRSYVPQSVIRRMNNQISNPKYDPYNYTSIMYVNNTRNKEELKNDLDNI